MKEIKYFVAHDFISIINYIYYFISIITIYFTNHSLISIFLFKNVNKQLNTKCLFPLVIIISGVSIVNLILYLIPTYKNK